MPDTPQTRSQLQTAMADNDSGLITAQVMRDFVVSVPLNLGAYTSGTGYVANDMVVYEGTAYICTLASTGNPPSDATHWQPFGLATSGTSILKANGSGGFSNAVAGTDYISPAGGTITGALNLNGLTTMGATLDLAGNLLADSAHGPVYYAGSLFFGNGPQLTDASGNLYYGRQSGGGNHKLADASGNLYFPDGTTVLADISGNLHGNGSNLTGMASTQVGLGNVSNNLQLTAANNLSDLANAATARTNLGLGTAATQASSAFDVSGAASTVNTALTTHIADHTNPHATTATQVGLGNVANSLQLIAASNLSDLGNAATARTNLGLGTAAVQASSAFDASGAATSAVSTHAGLTATHGVAGAIVGTTDAQALTHKTITDASNAISASLLTSGTVPTAALGAGTASSTTFLRGDQTWAAAGSTTFANPTASIGLTAVNGSATTPMRSDAAPAIDQGITPTWTGSHNFSEGAIVDGVIGVTVGRSVITNGFITMAPYYSYGQYGMSDGSQQLQVTGAGIKIGGSNLLQFFPADTNGYGGASDVSVFRAGTATLGIGGAFSVNAAQTTVNGSTSGSATFSQPIVGSTGEVSIYASSLVGTATWTFPNPFAHTPVVVVTNGLATTKVTSLSTTSVTVTGTNDTGYWVIKGTN